MSAVWYHYIRHQKRFLDLSKICSSYNIAPLIADPLIYDHGWLSVFLYRPGPNTFFSGDFT